MSKEMKVMKTKSDNVALADFVRERNQYEHKHQLNHNSRNYEVRKKFKQAGIIPNYEGRDADAALGDFQITPSTDLDLISDESLKKINKDLKKVKSNELLKRVRKVNHTDYTVCGCFDCQMKADAKALQVNPAKKT